MTRVNYAVYPKTELTIDQDILLRDLAKEGYIAMVTVKGKYVIGKYTTNKETLKKLGAKVN